MAFDPEKITFFAQTDARGQRTRFGIKARDRQRHVYTIGKTGMGKSTMLENMAIQDIQNGEGIAFIDPHGSSAEKLLEYIPEERVDDVLYFAPFDMDYPVAFNIMEDVGPDKRHLVVSGLMSVFAKIWVDAWSARMEYILQNTLLALLEYPDSTLLGVNKMLSDKQYREKVVANVTDPGVKSFWLDEFAKYTDRFAAEATPAIQNKIGQFTSNPLIRNIIGQPKSSFDLRKIMDEQKICIINLSKGLVGESNANLLGSMLTTRIYLAAMSRANLSPREMQEAPNFYFYVDEFQSFANATFANILSESRKYHLNLTIAHQYIEQMEEEVKNAVFGNVGTIVSFRVGPFDAEVLETVFAPQFSATDLVNLSARQIYLTLMIDGIGSPPFSATTLPPIEPPTSSYKDVVITASRKKFANERVNVEQVVEKFHGPSEESSAPPKRNGPSERRNNDQNRHNTHQQQQQNGAQHRSGGPERQRNNEQRKPDQQKDHPGKPPKQKQQNLDELRSVLKNMTQGSSKSDQPKEPKHTKNNEQKNGRTNEQKHKGELKDALKGVLSDVQPSNSQQSGSGNNKQKPEQERPRTGDASKQREAKVPKHDTQPAPTSPQTPAASGGHTQTSQQTDVPKQREVKEQERSAQQTPTPRPTNERSLDKRPPRERERSHASQKDHTPTPPQTESPKPPQEGQQTKHDEVSPKELERMMRITTSDRSPFR